MNTKPTSDSQPRQRDPGFHFVQLEPRSGRKMNRPLRPIAPLMAALASRLYRARPITTLLLALFVANGVQSQVVNGRSLESRVFLRNVSLETAQSEYAKDLASKLNEINRACQLNPDQQRLLELAGKGDIKRFFDRYFAMKEKVEKTKLSLDSPDLSLEIDKLRVFGTSGLFHDSSLMGKTTRTILTPGQLERYEAMTLKAHQELTGKSIAAFEGSLGHSVSWPSENRNKFDAFLRKKVRLVRNSGSWGAASIAIQLGTIDKTEYERFLAPEQRQHLESWIRVLEPYVASIQEAGYFDLAEEMDQVLKDATSSKAKK